MAVGVFGWGVVALGLGLVVGGELGEELLVLVGGRILDGKVVDAGGLLDVVVICNALRPSKYLILI